ncbi:MAG: septum formation initiator family protein [Phascolarctobacterium sp.]|nr:septum formation initiator family protein [Phascolarctobacterium sp.]
MKRRKNSFFKWVMLFLIGVGLVTLGVKEYKINKIKEEQAATQARIEALKKEEAALKEERKKLDDPKHIEKLAREEFNMVGKNEVPLFIVDKDKEKNEAEKK